MTKQLLITLRPADYFFFGGENTFDTDAKAGVHNYLVRSRKWPQQTSVLGLLRHILRNSGLDFGPESFDAGFGCQAIQNDEQDVKIEHQLFGKLHSLSPLFLQQGTGADRRLLLPASKLWLEDGEELAVNFEETAGRFYRGNTWTNQANLVYFDTEKEKKLPYTEKQFLGNFWIALDNGEKFPEDFSIEKGAGIFSSDWHIGIDKMSRMKSTGKGDEEGFYKQEFIRFAPGFRFAVIATVEGQLPTKVFNCTMPFGGEQRTFIIEAEEWTPALQAKWTPVTAYGNRLDRIVLVSDTYVEKPEKLFSHCRLVVAKSIPFRNIQIKEPAKGQKPCYDFENLHQKKRKKLLHLIKRGSVLFPIPGKEQEVMDLLKADCNFSNIGYNYFFPHQAYLQ